MLHTLFHDSYCLVSYSWQLRSYVRSMLSEPPHSPSFSILDNPSSCSLPLFVTCSSFFLLFPELSLSICLEILDMAVRLQSQKKNQEQQLQDFSFFIPFAGSVHGYTSQYGASCHHSLIVLTCSDCNHNFSFLPYSLPCLLFIRFDLRTVTQPAFSHSVFIPTKCQNLVSDRFFFPP